jgi:hypothetical protein
MYLRQMALLGQVKARQNEDERQGVKQLIAMASNINQMAKAAHQQGLLTAMMLFERYRKQFDELINRLTND